MSDTMNTTEADSTPPNSPAVGAPVHRGVRPHARTLADHIEQRMRTWRQQQMNCSGDRLALDDFMGEDSIADLVDFVCDEYAMPLPPPLTREQIDAVMTEHYPLSSLLREEVDAFERCVRGLERLHGIGA